MLFSLEIRKLLLKIITLVFELLKHEFILLLWCLDFADFKIQWFDLAFVVYYHRSEQVHLLSLSLIVVLSLLESTYLLWTLQHSICVHQFLQLHSILGYSAKWLFAEKVWKLVHLCDHFHEDFFHRVICLVSWAANIAQVLLNATVANQSLQALICLLRFDQLLILLAENFSDLSIFFVWAGADVRQVAGQVSWNWLIRCRRKVATACMKILVRDVFCLFSAIIEHLANRLIN